MTTRLAKKFLLGLVGAVVISVVISMFTATSAVTSLRYTVTDLGTLGSGSWRVQRYSPQSTGCLMEQRHN